MGSNPTPRTCLLMDMNTSFAKAGKNRVYATLSKYTVALEHLGRYCLLRSVNEEAGLQGFKHSGFAGSEVCRRMGTEQTL